MIINFDIADKSGASRGSASVKVDFGGKVWTLQSDPQQLMQRIGLATRGTVESQSWQVLWLQAQKPAKTQLIVWDPPTSETDPVHVSGKVRIYAPKDTAFTDSISAWKVAGAAPAPGGSSGPISGIRSTVINQIVPEVLPCTFGDAKAKKNMYNPEQKAAGTNCYCLTSYVAFKLKKPLKFAGTTGMPESGRRYNAWVNAKDCPAGPKPGDLYALCSGTLDDQHITHVGVMVDPSGANWKTADYGQLGGWDGKYVTRAYDKATNGLEGETRDGRAFRPIYGWIDIDLLVK
ncbi:MAG TPA: hypothetical protein VKU19_35655 [Bryobacteraceae bacterium]|nr:hypothetical protein [Bryobacteraceae bacterium]